MARRRRNRRQAPAPQDAQASWQAYLEVCDGAGATKSAESTYLQLAAFTIEEQYNGGWSGAAILVSRGDEPASLGRLLGAALTQKVVPGQQVVLHLTLGGEEQTSVRGLIVRSWPCLVSGVTPLDIEGEHLAGACSVGLTDPVSYLSTRPLWGVYQGSSAGEIVGGVLSLAAGGDGKPGLAPVLPGLPVVTITEDLREALSEIPYAIAVGEPLGAWLGDFLGEIGVCMELAGSTENDSVTARVSDRLPRGDPLEMQLLVGGDTSTAGQMAADPAYLTAVSAKPGMALRGQLLDDPSLGSLRRLGPGGAVGRLFLGPGVDLDEATDRAQRSLKGAHAGMLHVSIRSAQSSLRPGRLLQFDLTISGQAKWQVAWVGHQFRNGEYGNTATVLRADVRWCPPAPLPRPAVIVSGFVDGGAGHDAHQPVMRNRLGQIPISFPFAPSLIGNEAVHVRVADTNRDGRVTLNDFTMEKREEYDSLTPFWDREARKLHAGEYDDPFPGQADEDLEPEQLEQRMSMARRRVAIIRYEAYMEAKRRADRAGQGGGSPGQPGAGDTAEWPPRVMLNVLQPMAGSLHGFISAHRQGDSCRVAVHTPMWAEVVGFQYREDRQIHAGIVGATTGIVVEHDHHDAWSGMVFRPTENLEGGDDTSSNGGDE